MTRAVIFTGMSLVLDCHLEALCRALHLALLFAECFRAVCVLTSVTDTDSTVGSSAADGCMQSLS
jgi:hypothetical protein